MKRLKQILEQFFFQFLLEMVNLNPLRLFWSVKIFNESVRKTSTLWLGKVSPTDRLERFTKIGISTVQKLVIWLINFTCSVNEKNYHIIRTCFFFEWEKISIFNILYILYKIVGDSNFGSIIYFWWKRQ